MERKEAVDILRSILDKCSTENITKVMIMPSTINNGYSSGSQIYIEATFDNEAKHFLQSIAAQKNLAIKEEQNRIIIYKPIDMIKI